MCFCVKVYAVPLALRRLCVRVRLSVSHLAVVVVVCVCLRSNQHFRSNDGGTRHSVSALETRGQALDVLALSWLRSVCWEFGEVVCVQYSATQKHAQIGAAADVMGDFLCLHSNLNVGVDICMWV